MPDLADGESVEMQGSGSKPYILKNTGGVYSCTCPAWRNQSTGIERRTCKHLRKLRGDEAEEARLGGALPQKPVKAKADGEEEAEGPPVLLAESWDNSQDLTDWWMSEKLDGVRAYWDGTQFLSRQGNIYHAPDWFIEGLPDYPLDGELWLDRKAFQRTIAIVRRQDKPKTWESIKFVVFDAPGKKLKFEERQGFLEEAIHDWASKYTQLLAQVQCESTDHLRQELARIEALGGEGLMLRQPASKYVAGRSSTLLKVKTFRDAEAKVIGIEPGKGKHSGKMGALMVEMDGKRFNVGTGFSDKERANAPGIGSMITFRYQELTDGGIPRFPSFVRLHTAASAPSMSEEKPKTKKTQVPVSEEPPKKPIVKQETTMTKTERYFECTEDGAAKFWAITMDGCDVTTRWGKIGTDGQTKTKSFPTEEKAQKEYDKLLKEKTGKGYEEK